MRSSRPPSRQAGWPDDRLLSRPLRLRLRLEVQVPEERVAFLRAGNAYIELFQYDPLSTLAPRRTPRESGLLHFAVDVDDIEAEYERLIAAGVEFEGPPADALTVRFCFAFDPEGNKIELMQFVDADLPFHLRRAHERATDRDASEQAKVVTAGETLRRFLEGEAAPV